MKRFHCLAGSLLGICLHSEPAIMAQTNPSTAERWLATVEAGPEFKVAESRRGWERQRKQVREQLWKLLGNLPARPKVPTVRTISREDRAAYVVEKFAFANGAGSTVPGYLLLPKGVSSPAPAILYCHWHGGQYDIGKEELFGTNATPVPAGPELGEARLRRHRSRCLLLRRTQWRGTRRSGGEGLRGRNDRQ